MKKSLLLLPLIVIVAFAAARGGPTKIELPPETASFKLAPGSEIANGQCLTCHSVEYVTMQPPLPRTFWAGSVKKMMDKYSAPVPADQVEPLVDYLTKHYGAATNAPASEPAASSPPPATKPVTATTASAEQLATKYGCLGCHNATVKIVGPSYRDVATKYKSDPDAAKKIGEQIRQGGSGKWGPIIMPPFPQVGQAEIKVMTDWILHQQ